MKFHVTYRQTVQRTRPPREIGRIKNLKDKKNEKERDEETNKR